MLHVAGEGCGTEVENQAKKKEYNQQRQTTGDTKESPRQILDVSITKLGISSCLSMLLESMYLKDFALSEEIGVVCKKQRNRDDQQVA